MPFPSTLCYCRRIFRSLIFARRLKELCRILRSLPSKHSAPTPRQQIWDLIGKSVLAVLHSHHNALSPLLFQTAAYFSRLR